ncbi:hypothetical protein [Agreia sp. COWG]|uniref:hypothetical protein n=1 Tax=Agreia sp. COWG TaxID=2773266 RepID=UPI0019295265|nr:hypothetical protein [Agreia sp. COWG]CAD5999432.1 conserved protein of unknown function [Agreia sp. COWG]
MSTPIPTPPRAGLRVSSRGATRRLQALHHCGYDTLDLAHQLAWSDTIIEQLLTTPPQTILATSHERVIKYFKQLRDIPASGSPQRITAAKQRADDAQWAGPFDWDDIDTDIKPAHRRSMTHAEVDSKRAQAASNADLFATPSTTSEPLTDADAPDEVEPVTEAPTPTPDVAATVGPVEQADIHAGMTEKQKRGHYSAGCREPGCRKAVADAARDRREAAAAKTSGGDQGSNSRTDELTPTSSRVGGKPGDAVPEPSPVVHTAPTPPEPTADAAPIETTREEHLEHHIRAVEAELVDAIAHGSDALAERNQAATALAELQAVVDEQAKLLERFNFGDGAADPDAAPPVVDPRDEQLVLLVAEVGQLEKKNAELTSALEHGRQVLADELDLRATLLAQVADLEKNTPPAAVASGVTVTVHIGGVRVA